MNWTRRGALAAGAMMGFGMSRAMAGATTFSNKALAAIRQPGEAAIASGDIPGVVTMVWRKGELREVQTAGLRDIERRLPMQRDTLMGIASMSKPVTVAAALALVEQGAMRLDDPITKWAPEFASMRVLSKAGGPLDDTYPAPRMITIEDLMTHRSGLSYGAMTPGPLGVALMQKFGMGISSEMAPDEWMKALAALPLPYAPGERFNYGHSIDVLGFVIGRAAGTSLHEVMQTNLFDPLGMADTDFWIPPQKRDRAAVIYSSAAPGTFTPITVDSFVGAARPAYTSGGQGLISTADDYMAFARMLVRGGQGDRRRVLKPETVKMMTADRMTTAQKVFSPAAPDWRSYGFGLGVQVITNPANNARGAGRAGAFGWGGAFGGWWQGDPAEDMALLWLQHTLPAPPSAGSLKAGGMPHIPGLVGTLGFQKAVYATLDG